MGKRKAPAQLRALAQNEQMRILDYLKQHHSFRDYTLVALCLRTGLRNAEARCLNVGDVMKFNAIVNTLEVRPEIAKNGVARRIPLVTEVQKILYIYIQWKGDHHETIEYHNPLFLTQRTHQRLGERDFQRLMENASTASIGMKFTPHDLRHTFATELYQATGDLEAVRIALGHSSLKATSIYMHTSPDQLRERFERAFSSRIL